MSSKQAKRALFSSFWALLLCFAMLLGTTFAWFTDTATTGVNKIQAGNLDIEVSYTLDGQEWAELAEASDIFAGHLWEPGHTGLVGLKIHNAGNLALKYKIGLNIVKETKGVNKANQEFKLSDYLKISYTTFPDMGYLTQFGIENIFNGEDIDWFEGSFTDQLIEQYDDLHQADQYYFIKVKMPETVGNEANAIDIEHTPSVQFGINVYATQYTYESDSTGNQYDKDATYRNLTSTETYNGTTYDGKTVQLKAQDIKHTFKYSDYNDGKAVYLKNGTELTLDDVTLTATTENDTSKRNIGFFVYNGASLTINSGTYSITGKYGCMIWVQQGTTGQSTVTINGGSFTSNCENGGMINAYDGTKVTITGGLFDQSAGNPNVTLQCKNNNQITVTGGTFVNYNPTGHCTIPAGYHVESAAQADGTTWYTVVANQ